MKGITHILSVGDFEIKRYEDEFTYIKFAVGDAPDQDISQFFEESNAFVTRCLEDGGKVLIHCAAGISRSTTVLCAYLMKTTGQNLDDVLKHVRTKRPIATPNMGFREQLKKYQAELGIE